MNDDWTICASSWRERALRESALGLAALGEGGADPGEVAGTASRKRQRGDDRPPQELVERHSFPAAELCQRAGEGELGGIEDRGVDLIRR